MKTYNKPRITDIRLEDDSAAQMQADPTAAMQIAMAQRSSGANACGIAVTDAAAGANPFAVNANLFQGVGKPSCDAGAANVYPSSGAISAAIAAGYTVNQKGFNFESVYNCDAT